MKAKELIDAGFTMDIGKSCFWYILLKGKHLFITNDSVFNKGKDTWCIYYQNMETYEVCFFSKRLKEMGQFKIIFRILTGKEFKLANQQKLINRQ